MSFAAHNRKLYVKATSAAPIAGDELDGAITFSFSTSRDVLDTTNYKGSDTRTKMLGLKDGSVKDGTASRTARSSMMKWTGRRSSPPPWVTSSCSACCAAGSLIAAMAWSKRAPV